MREANVEEERREGMSYFNGNIHLAGELRLRKIVRSVSGVNPCLDRSSTDCPKILEAAAFVTPFLLFKKVSYIILILSKLVFHRLLDWIVEVYAQDPL